ncbi:helix-turn-helix domain-containing protein [Elioraea sp.]|uniref:helix-turn-helix transcriptional regulator n=1 Tax=Elioraea sp. TaxID=2185103 RepID=UPI00307E6571
MSQNNTHQSHAAPAARPSQPIRHLTQIELAQRWRISPRTLERWRWLGQGPRYLKIGGRVVYRLEDVEAFEDEKRQEAGR